MQSRNISLPDPLKQFVDAQIAQGRYSSVSEYVRELIRADEKRKAEEQLETLLLEGLQGEEAEFTREDWQAIRQEALAQVKKVRKSPHLMGRVYRRPAARHDLIAHYCYLVENAGEAVADEFLSRVEASFNDLLEQPKIGAPLTLRPAELAGLRKWPVKDFDNVLIFYLPHPNGVSIVRILHAARDWWSLLGIEP